MATSYFELVAYAISIGVSQAVPVAVVAFFGVRARVVAVCCVGVVVTSGCVLATSYFELVAYTVAVLVVQAVAVAIVSVFSVRT